MKALLINSKDKTVTKVQIKDYKEIYGLIGNGCSTFACPVEFDNGDVLYCDDEGLLKEKVEGCFMFPEWNTPIVGNAVILGSDDDGQSIDAKTNISFFTENLIWGNEAVAEEYRNFALSQPITIVTDFE